MGIGTPGDTRHSVFIKVIYYEDVLYQRNYVLVLLLVITGWPLKPFSSCRNSHARCHQWVKLRSKTAGIFFYFLDLHHIYYISYVSFSFSGPPLPCYTSSCHLPILPSPSPPSPPSPTAAHTPLHRRFTRLSYLAFLGMC